MAPKEKEPLADRLRRAVTADPKDEERAEQARREHEKAMVKAAIAWLREKWGSDPRSAPCPYCGNDVFAVGPPVEVHPFGRQNRIQAFIPVTCTNCAQTAFLDAAQSTGFPIPHEMKDPDEGS